MVYPHPLAEAEGHRGHRGHDHADAEKVPEVHAFRDHAGEEHSEGVGEEVGSVQRPQEPLCVCLILPVDLG